MFPLVFLFENLTHLITRVFGSKEKPLITEEEIKTIVSLGEEIGQIKESEKQMIHRIFKFDDMDAKDIIKAMKSKKTQAFGLRQFFRISDFPHICPQAK